MTTKIVLVDSEQLARQGLKSLLEDHGFQVAGQTDDGRMALKLVQKLRPDVVISDLCIGGLNGLEFTRQIRQISLRTKVIILSNSADSQLLYALFAAGANGYLLKKATYDELAASIRAVLDGDTYLTPVLAHLLLRRSFAEPASRWERLQNKISNREREVLQLVAEGRSTKEIAATLYVSVKTIETHRKQIMDKLNVHSVAGLTKYAVRAGITPL
jgi:DNA-binding NarL/FixJ family response regulator